MIALRRAGDRYRTAVPGIVSLHCFSSGAHYEPDNLRFGPVIAVDEHIVEAGSGFTEHAHRDVELISWVIEGELRHQEPSGHGELVRPGLMQYQSAGSGIRHSEMNASPSRRLRFLQVWLDSDRPVQEPSYLLAPPPLEAGAVLIDVLHPREPVTLGGPGWAHVYVVRGPIRLGGDVLRNGDSVRLRGESVTVAGVGEVLVISNSGISAE